MKEIISIILTLMIYSIAYSQTKFCEENSVMYSVCYQLDTNRTFTYSFSHCTGSVNGVGTYVKSKKSLVFKFDTLQSPQIKKNNDTENNGKVTISIFNIFGEFALQSLKVVYKEHIYRTDSLGTVSIDYSSGPIILYQYFNKDSLVINPNTEQMNRYFIYWHSPGDTFVNKGNVIKMNKVRNKYELKEKKIGYDDDKGKYYSYKRRTYYIMEE